MKRRLRKKLRAGEFRQDGFEVTFRLSGDVDEAAVDAFWDHFIDTAIDSAGLMCGGGYGRAWDVFVSRPGRGSATDEDRHALAVWLERQPLVSDVRIGPLVDAWHAV
jgi:hypothetical protein